MEASPLSLAQSHAFHAARSSDTKAKVDYHELAALKFEEAVKVTQNPEAVRTLKLLVQYHQHLAQSIRARNSKSDGSTTEQGADSESAPRADKADVVFETPKEPRIRRTEAANALPSRVLNRESSSSIADRLASARGIPPNRSSRRGPTSSTNLVSKITEARMPTSNLITKRVAGEDTKNSTQSPSAKASTTMKFPITHQGTESTVHASPPAPNQSQATDEPFQRFYSTISPLLSKLTAPLAFAGLPLGLETPSTTLDAATHQPSSLSEPPTTSSTPLSGRRSTTTTTIAPPTANLAASHVSADPDYAPLFSKATLKVLRETDDGRNGISGGHAYPFGGAESFYVVPTTGGTKSYADILQRHGQVPDLSTASTGTTNDLDDEFVDASETPQPPSPQQSRRAAGIGRRLPSKQVGTTTQSTTIAPNGKTLEELQLENEMMKTICNDQANRIRDFELASQQVMEQNAALRHGIRESQMLVRPPSSSAGGSASLPRPSVPPPSTTTTKHTTNIKSRSKSESTIKTTNDDEEEEDGEANTLVLKLRLEALEKQKAEEAESLKRDNEKLRVVVGRYRERWEKLKEGARKTRRESSSAAGDAGGEGKEQQGN